MLVQDVVDEMYWWQILDIGPHQDSYSKYSLSDFGDNLMLVMFLA